MHVFRYLAPAALLLLAPSLQAEDARQLPDAKPLWAFEESDIPVDPDFRFGVLDNGMRYALRENGTPEGTVLVRLLIGSGSLDDRFLDSRLPGYWSACGHCASGRRLVPA